LKYRSTSAPRHLYHNVVVTLDRDKDINNGQPSALASWIQALDLKNLAAYPQAAAHAGDGAAFDPGPCDAMPINAGVTHPQALWLGRLRAGGRLAMPLTIAISPTIGQGIILKFVRLPGGFSVSLVTFLAIFNGGKLRDPELEAPLRNWLSKAMPTGTLLKLQSLRRDIQEPEESCLFHAPGICLSANPIISEPEEHP
jgi:hypothetical protein